jgi:hypothetical protein
MSSRFPVTPEEELTEQFYAWERRGRGCSVFSYPVNLEPPFRPFLGHFLLPSRSPIDDARKSTWISALADRFLGGGAAPRPAPGLPADLAAILAEPEPEPFEDEPQVEFEIVPARDFVAAREQAEAFLLSLTSARFPIAFEILSVAGSVSVLFAARESDAGLLRDQLRAFFTDAAVRVRKDSAASSWRKGSASESVVVEFGLLREFMLPLRTLKRLDPDPLISVFGALSGLEEGESGMLQLLFTATAHPWSESVMRAVSDGEGGSFFTDAPSLLKLAGEKVSRPLCAAVLRIAGRSPKRGRGWEIVRRLSGTVAQFGAPDGNEFVPLSVEGDHDLEEDLLARQSHRSGMLLSTEELIPLIHLPGASVRFPALAREEEAPSKAPPSVTREGGVLLGHCVHQGERVPVMLPTNFRMRHTHIVGASGSGKSTLLLSLILQDIARGEGVAVLDPHGDLIEEVLARIPEERLSDVVLLDPSDEDFPVGVNVLHARSERERTLLSSDLVAVFRRLSTTWGDQMHSVFANAIQAFLASERGGTLVDLRRFLVEEEFRESFLETVTDPEVVYYFRREFKLLVGRPQGPILTRLDSFLRPKLVRNMVAQREDRIDFRAVVENGKVFLAKLAQGAIGEENAALLGSLLVAKLNQVAMSREDLRPEARRPFHLVIDEFHNFVTPSMASLLSSARKYRVGLTLAHQELRQVESRDRDVLSSVLANAVTRIVFRVGDEDARKLEGGFSFFEAEDLKNLAVGEAICRIERSEDDFKLVTSPVLEVPEREARSKRTKIVAQSRERFARPRAEVEKELRENLTTAPPPLPFRTREVRREPAVPKEPVIEMPPARLVQLSVPLPRPKPPELPPLGRGGPQHRYVQELIKRWGEGHGYRATIEKQILDGLGSVDVALEREGFSFACEISVASTPEQELGNVQKCLASGFDEVALLSTEKKSLSKLKEVVLAGIEEKDRKRVLFVTPEELFAYLETHALAPESKETRVAGYKVKVAYRSATGSEEKTRARAISEVILKSIRRMKEK